MGKRERLADAIQKASDRWCDLPFAWGVSDCYLAIADVIQEALGYDPAPHMRGRYSTARGALRITAPDGGFAGAFRAVARRNNWKAINPRGALIGDVGLANDPTGNRLGAIKYRGGMWLIRGQQGFVATPTRKIVQAWRVA